MYTRKVSSDTVIGAIAEEELKDFNLSIKDFMQKEEKGEEIKSFLNKIGEDIFNEYFSKQRHEEKAKITVKISSKAKELLIIYNRIIGEEAIEDDENYDGDEDFDDDEEETFVIAEFVSMSEVINSVKYLKENTVNKLFKKDNKYFLAFLPHQQPVQISDFTKTKLLYSTEYDRFKEHAELILDNPVNKLRKII